MAKFIKVEFHVDNFLKPLDTDTWEEYVVRKLREAGIPIGRYLYHVKTGSLSRVDHPDDFGKTTYIWEE